VVSARHVEEHGHYLTDTVAPDLRRFFFNMSAAALVTRSFTGFGRPSTDPSAFLEAEHGERADDLDKDLDLFSPAATRMTVELGLLLGCHSTPRRAAGRAGTARRTAIGSREEPQLLRRRFESCAASSRLSLSSCSRSAQNYRGSQPVGMRYNATRRQPFDLLPAQVPL